MGTVAASRCCDPSPTPPRRSAFEISSCRRTPSTRTRRPRHTRKRNHARRHRDGVRVAFKRASQLQGGRRHDDRYRRRSAMSDTPWMTVEEVSAYMRLSTKTVYRLAASGQLKASRATGRKALRFLRQWCDENLMTVARPAGEKSAAPAADPVSV